MLATFPAAHRGKNRAGDVRARVVDHNLAGNLVHILVRNLACNLACNLATYRRAVAARNQGQGARRIRGVQYRRRPHPS